MNETDLSGRIIGCAMAVHTALGPGLLENVYKECLFYKLKKEGLAVEKEKPLPVIFEEAQIDCGYRLDLVVENEIVVELKSVKALDDIHLAQTLTYLKLGHYRLGLLINFNIKLLKDGIRRVIHDV
ncbi:MAG: GxxExxY protein [Kiritimatiellae bacterium]|jgi:GxxExxY protein|nr:GxxExxY protein [Kiritimatiellia bacterium]